jgi:hypothetical protein
MKFRVRVNNDDLPVEFVFAKQNDIAQLSRWRSPTNLCDNPHVQDAIEYCRLANKRWKSYQAIGRTAASVNEMTRAIKRDAHMEIVFVMLACAKWHNPSHILGFCFCRRTWCHHIIMDFAAAHPNAIGPAGGYVRGVGAGMLYSLVKMSDGLGIKTIWGEASANSANAKALALQSVSDHFFIEGRAFRHCLRQFKLLAWR